MNYGLYLSAGGTLASLHRQDVLANNLANINTVGFKPDEVQVRSRLPERIESIDSFAEPNLMLEQLGGGQFADPTRVGLRQGDLTETGNDLDLTIQGDGFFVVRTKADGKNNLRFTRDGRLSINPAGELVTATSGLPVLDVNDQTIRVNPNSKLRFDGDGTVLQNEIAIAKLQIGDVNDRLRLSKEGQSLMRFAGKRQTGSGELRQGAVESSAVDPIMALNAMINASKAVQANATMMQYHDNLIGQAVNTLGRVA